MQFPRIVISGLSGGAGKTMVSLGLARTLTRRGLRVRAFKKGPDYIDAAWLALAAGAPQATLDPFFSPPEALTALFRDGAQGYDLSLIEGNRGLFDGLDIHGSCSTAQVARQLAAPVLLVVDCTKVTRTAAALVAGCTHFEPDVHIGGVILNRTGNERHQTLVRRAVEELAGVPVLGVLPRKNPPFFSERYMGLAGTGEHSDADARLDQFADFLAAQVDIERIVRLAESAPPLIEPGPHCMPHSITLTSPAPSTVGSPATTPGERPLVGIVRDAAFWFYYQENITALENAGLEPVFLSLLDSSPWPDLDGLYIGGGLPELHAATLAGNSARRHEIASLSRSGLPIYAECGGLMYLVEELIVEGVSHPMAGVFSCAVELLPRPQGLGYIEARVHGPNPFHPVGTLLRGHEFHFSHCLPRPGSALTPVLRLHRGKGLGAGFGGTPSPALPEMKASAHKGCTLPPAHAAAQPGVSLSFPGSPNHQGTENTAPETGLDGLCVHNTYAGYAHIFAPSLPHWAPTFAALCRAFQAKKAGGKKRRI